MKNLRGTYVHRGDARRRRVRLKQSVLLVGFFGAAAFLLGNRKPAAQSAEAAPVRSSGGFHISLNTNRTVAAELDSTRGELELMRAQLDRANKVIAYSSQYRIAADLAGSIVDVASAEGIAP